jgi:3-oxoacyl-[acyl-carrier protein] reductase
VTDGAPVIWVTGASRGIGRAIALACAAEGAQLVLTARAASHLEETASSVANGGGQAPVLLDYEISDLKAVEGAFHGVFRQFGRLDGLVNNAGIMQDALLGMISTEQMHSTFSVNVYSTIWHMQCASRVMVRAGKGSIVNVSSIMGRSGGAGKTVYSASKAAVIGATRAAAKELAPHGVRVNAIAPGIIDTDLIKGVAAPRLKSAIGSVGMGRLGSPEEVAQLAAYLLSGRSQYVTGQVIGVDGCMTA